MISLSAKFCFKEKCFILSKTSGGDYATGSSYCQSIGAKLVKISSPPENEYVRGVIMESTADASWPSVYIGKKESFKKYDKRLLGT